MTDRDQLRSNKSLIALVSESAGLEQALIESGGEITPAIEALLVTKDLHLPEKVDAYSLVIDRMEVVSAFYKAKADEFLRLAKAADNVVDRCEVNLRLSMEAMHTDEILGHDVKYRLVRSNPACVITDENAVDGAYKVTETITKIDKKRLIEDLKVAPVAGARLEQGFSLRRYLNSPAKKAVSK